MESRRIKIFSSFFLITSTFVCFVTSSQEHNGTSSSTQTQITTRQTLEIIIGIGSPPPAYPPDDPDWMPPPEPVACTPPPPPPPVCNLPPPPPPPPPLAANLRQAIKVIQRLKKRLKPTPITDTWTGNKICYDKSKYKGFFCYRRKNESNYRVGGVKFNGFSFTGRNCPQDAQLKDFIGTVSEDQVFFHINSNNFSGDIPVEILKLPRFYELDLSNNKFTGPFPKPILSTDLTILDLRFNKFTGQLPPKLFELDLDLLFLNNNEFYGSLPENLGKLPVLYLSLARNKFTGSIPNSIGQASRNLLEILLLDNQLSGCLPYEIGLLKKTRLFDASFNQLTGPIPHSFGCLEKLNTMNISNNQLYGEVPEWLCKLGDLKKLQFKFNYLTQVGPECRKLIQDGVLDVTMNCILDLPSQRTPKECTDFFSKKYICPDAQRLVTQLPCKIDDQYPRSREITPRTEEAMAPSPSYAALNNRRALLSMQEIL